MASIPPQTHRSVDHPLALQRGNFQLTQNQRTAKSEPSTTGGAWGLRYPGYVMGTGGKNEVKEFTGMWRLKPDADLVALTKTLALSGWLDPPGASVSVQTTGLGLIRTARWFVARY